MENIKVESPLPKYYQLAQIIKRQAKNKTFKPDSPLPSIPSLMKKYAVSQNTVRQAIATLIKEEVLYTDQGRGTFIRPDHGTRKGTGLIGVLVPDLEEPSLFAGVTRAIEEEVYKKEGSLLLSHTDNDYRRFKKYIRLYQEKRVDGVIIVPIHTEKYEEENLSILRQVEKASIPYILVDEYLENYPTDCVLINNEEMGYLLTRHLLEQGYERIAFVTGPYCSSIRDRLNGYKKALEEADVPYDSNLVSFSKGRFRKDAYLLSKNLLTKENPDAFFGVNDGFALGAFKAIEEAGFSVPGDIGLVGFDDSIIASQLKVPLTTVRQPRQELGEKSVQLLMKRIEHPNKEVEEVMLSGKLIIRESSKKKM